MADNEDVFTREKRINYQYGSNNVCIREVEVVNKSAECVYTWYYNQTLNESKNPKESLLQFLGYKYPSADFRLIDILFHLDVYDDVPIVGFSFIRRIKPGHSFWYIILNEDEYKKEHIFFIKESEADNYLVRGSILERVLFKNDYIVLK